MSAPHRLPDVDDPDSGRDSSPLPPEEMERVMRRFFERHGATLAQKAAPPAPVSQVRPARPPTPVEPTVSLPVFTGDPRPQGIREMPAHNDVDPPRAPPSCRPEVVPVPAAFVRTEAPVPRSPEEWARAGALPFQPSAPLQPVPGHALGGTQQLPVMGLGTGKTAPVEDDALARAIALAIAAHPLPTGAPGEVLADFPRLTLQQYASLRAELGVAPEQVRAILPRYGVESVAAHRALNGWWETYFARQPAARVTFHDDRERFMEWLRAQRRQRG
jgi:hypothetical protein